MTLAIVFARTLRLSFGLQVHSNGTTRQNPLLFLWLEFIELLQNTLCLSVHLFPRRSYLFFVWSIGLDSVTRLKDFLEGNLAQPPVLFDPFFGISWWRPYEVFYLWIPFCQELVSDGLYLAKVC